MYCAQVIVAAVSLNAILVAAAPAPAPAPAPASAADADANAQLNKRATASVLMCNDINSEGNCQTQKIPLGACTAFTNGYAGNLGTIQNLSADEVTCHWFLTADCSGASYDNQDDQNLTDGNGDFAAAKAASCM